MKKTVLTIIQNRRLTDDVFKMELEGDVSAISRPGQFVNIELDGLYLRRPISVCDLSGGVLTLVYKKVGVGTEKMSVLAPGDRLDMLTGLGNGYDIEKSGERPLLIGGGAGVPPLYLLCRRLIAAGKTPKAALGFNTAGEVFMEGDFNALGVETFVSTADGTYGTAGFVTKIAENLNGQFDYTFTCGPEPMMRAVYDSVKTDGQYSFEERMGCGFGACMGCSCQTKYGAKRICRDGPVLERGEIIW